jgi:hypothetical protein
MWISKSKMERLLGEAFATGVRAGYLCGQLNEVNKIYAEKTGISIEKVEPMTSIEAQIERILREKGV